MLKCHYPLRRNTETPFKNLSTITVVHVTDKIMNENINITPTADEVMHIGLQYVGYNQRQLQVCRETLLSRFRSHYGSNPIVYSELFEDLKTTLIQNARIEGKHACLKHFLRLSTLCNAMQQSTRFRRDLNWMKKQHENG